MYTRTVPRSTARSPLGAATCCSHFLLTCALWVTPSRPKVHDEWGLNLILNTHDQCGVQSTQGALYKAVAHDMGVSVSGNTTVPCHLQNERYVDSLWTHAMRSDENTGVDYWWTDLCDLGTPGQGEAHARSNALNSRGNRCRGGLVACTLVGRSSRQRSFQRVAHPATSMLMY